MPSRNEEIERKERAAKLRKERALDRKIARTTALIGTGVGVSGLLAATQARKGVKSTAAVAEIAKDKGILGALAGKEHGYSLRRRFLDGFRRKVKLNAKGRQILLSLGESLGLEDKICEKRFATELAKFITFDEVTDAMRDARRVRNQMKKFVKQGRTGYSAARDIEDKVKGEKRNPRKKFFWEKQGFKDAALATALTGAIGGGAILANKKGWMGRIARGAKATKPNTGYTPDPNFKLNAISELFELDAIDMLDGDKGWRTSRPTSSSVRVHKDGSSRRDRRRKYWYERKANRDKMIAGGIATGVLGLTGGLVAAKRSGKKAKKALDALKRQRRRTVPVAITQAGDDGGDLQSVITKVRNKNLTKEKIKIGG